MRAFSIILTIFLFQSISFAQHTNSKGSVIKDAAGNPIVGRPINDIPDGHIIFCDLSIEFPAWIEPAKWARYLAANLVLDDRSLDSIPAGNYQVMVQFVIDREGTITDVSITTDPGYRLGQRALSVVSNYKGRWQPAIRNGRNVKSFHKQPITFVVEEENFDKIADK